MAKRLDYNATLVAREDMTDQLAVFTVKPDEPVKDSLPLFLAGQYAVLGLNNEENVELGSVRRPMSIASGPYETEALEFYIRFVSHPESENPLTHLLWKISAGARLYLGPKVTGKFTLEDTVGTGDRRLKICVAAGTGLAPFLSMARDVLQRDGGQAAEDPRALADFVILHGASYPEDLGYRDELEELSRRHGLHYYASVSRPKERPDWQGDAGRVEDYFRPERLAQLETRLGLPPGGFTPSTAAIFICGLQGTIGETILRLIPRGFVPENRRLRKALEVAPEVHASLFFEQYDTTPVINLQDPDLMAALRSQLAAALD